MILRVRNALRAVKTPDGGDIISNGSVQGLAVDGDGVVRFVLETTLEDNNGESLMTAARKAAGEVDGVVKVAAVATTHRKQGTTTTRAASGHDNPLGMKKSDGEGDIAANIAGVKTIIAIASGKGGVGKSTLAANLAVTFANMGLRTGLLDADIYGPSLPTLFGISDKAAMIDGKIQPVEKFGVRAMSIGLIVDPDQALAWRGPMVMGALRQLLRDVAWGELDLLLVDTPPGTGDAHLSLIQTKRLDGAVIVSTPQEMALADVRRGVALFRKTNIPIVGVVENMAWLETEYGDRQYIFGKGGAEDAASSLEAPFLGAVPLIPELRSASDEGAPLANSKIERLRLFEPIANRILTAIQSG